MSQNTVNNLDLRRTKLREGNRCIHCGKIQFRADTRTKGRHKIGCPKR